MLQLDHIAKSFGPRELFEDVTWRIQPGERIGLVGPNGAGKTTLFRIIARQEEPDGGRIVHPGGYTIGYLPQEVGMEPDAILLDEVLSGRQDLLELEAQMHQLTAAMSAPGLPEAERAEISARYGQLESRFSLEDGYALRARARAILTGMGFAPGSMDTPMGEFSGGWQVRAYLSRLLLQSPDLLLMDEPTNHLDLPSLEWLEGFLRGYPGSVIIISHDRYFLNRMVTRIADLDHHTVTVYEGDYDSFIAKKAEESERLKKAAAQQQKQIEHMESFVRRFKAKATKAAQARSRLKALEKIERIEVPQDAQKSVKFRFPQPSRSGQDVMLLRDIHKAYGDHVVYESLGFEMKRGERVALVGPNGAGKSTLLKILAKATSFGGLREEGYNVSIAFFAQHQVEALDLGATVLQEMERAAPIETIGQVRSILGAFLFSGEAVDKPIQVLSGGEKSRLALAKMLLNPANLLLLDEPTNHLDISSRDVLEEALCNFDGTLCFVSHDRHFINSVATRVVHVEDGQALSYPGDYEYYHWKRSQEAEQQQELAQEEDGSDKLSRKDRKRREAELRREKAAAMGSLKKDLAAVEVRIAKLEQEKEQLQAQMADPALYEDGNKAQAVARRDAEVDASLEEAMLSWEELAAQVEEIEASFT